MSLHRLAATVLFLSLILHAAVLPAQSPDSPAERSDDSIPAGNEKVREIFRTFGGRGAMADDSKPTPPDEMRSRFQVREGLEIDVVAHEPDLSQPLSLAWDSRGRMWVMQYRQYQYPAGLKVVQFDQHLRAVFDKVPEPPPRGTPGADRVTVFEDTDGDGWFDQSKDVITGLNIATSVQIGPQGIWVLNPPYLLRYPDADHDDVPDGDPEVHLSGFGLQDTHSVANSLRFGPDGWLYGANGSTTGGTVSSEVTKGVRFQGQCIWRYHPETKVFEIFAEGGGNTFSLEIDSKGRVFSGTNGGSKRGYHYPQGSYADKNWGKHGPLTNPYAFGYFRGMGFEGDSRRFAQAFCIYEGGLFPNEYDGTIIAPNSLHNLVWNSRRIENGSTYRTLDVENLIDSDDRWFRPVDVEVGPDGAVYLADWYDTRLSHVSPVDDWHKESGRVYRLRPEGDVPVYRGGDLHTLPSDELIRRFDDPNKWIRMRSTLELGWRGDVSVVGRLVDLVAEQGSLEALWALHLMGELTTNRAGDWITHSDPHIRRWTVRLLGDRHQGHSAMIELAAEESNPQVRAQLASTAKRIDSATGLAVIERLSRREDDLQDPHLPLLYWWALEAHANDWQAVRRLVSTSGFWQRPIARQVLLGRLMQRYAASGSEADLAHADELIAMAPDQSSREILLLGMMKAFQGRSLPELPERLDQALAEYQASRGQAGVVVGLRSGRGGAIEEALKLLNNRNADLGTQIEVVTTLGQIELQKPSRVVDTLLRLATARSTSEPSLQRVAIAALAGFDDDRVDDQLIGSFYSRISDEHDLRATACRTLSSRKSWAKRLVREVNEWRLKVHQVPRDVIQRLRSYEDPELFAAVEAAFGKAVTVTSEEKVAEINRLVDLLAGNRGDSDRGQVLFAKQCGTCHKLFGEGKAIGPPLDGYERSNLKFWLNAIIEPSLEIREGYQSYRALTEDGRVVTGMVDAQDTGSVTIRTADDRRVVLQRDRLEQFAAMKSSLMPEDLFKDMSDTQIVDLFAYLTLGTGR
jgi:putative heme-binding domain-containing protein